MGSTKRASVLDAQSAGRSSEDRPRPIRVHPTRCENTAATNQTYNWRGGRAVECTGLENQQRLVAFRGFESHPLRQNKNGSLQGPFFVPAVGAPTRTPGSIERAKFSDTAGTATCSCGAGFSPGVAIVAELLEVSSVDAKHAISQILGISLLARSLHTVKRRGQSPGYPFMRQAEFGKNL